MMKLEPLREAGLTDGEVKVYIGLLSIGSSTTGPIVDESGISRSIVYQILEKLIEKGLVSYVIKEKTRYYQSAEPQKILDYIDVRAKEIQSNRDHVKKMLPQLKLKMDEAPPSEVRIFEGFKGMVTVHEHTYDRLESGEEYFYLGIAEHQPEFMHAYWKKDHKRRAKAGIKTKLLFNQSADRSILENRNSYWGSDARYMPIDIDTPAWFVGYKDIAVISIPSENPITIEIKNKKIADSFKAYFDAFWKDSKVFRS